MFIRRVGFKIIMDSKIAHKESTGNIISLWEGLSIGGTTIHGKRNLWDVDSVGNLRLEEIYRKGSH